MKIISIIGAFGKGYNLLNGQTIKTKTLTEELELSYGRKNVYSIDTYGKKNNFFSLIKCIFALYNSKNIMMLPAQNALRILAPWLVMWNKLFKRRLHYVVIGGWLDKYLDANPLTEKKLHKFYKIYVETHTMLKALQKRGFTNVVVLPNCKDLKILNEVDLVYPQSEPFRLITFSRVMKQKGIEDAARIISEINEEAGKRMFELDIYGPIEVKETEWFDALISRYKLTEENSAVRYKGRVSFEKSVEVISSYFALLFPTRFYTEGIPGTIIDAFAAGVPVISAKWENFVDVIDDGFTGIGFDFEKWDELKEILWEILSNPDKINRMRKTCLIKAHDFLPSKVIQKIYLQ